MSSTKADVLIEKITNLVERMDLVSILDDESYLSTVIEYIFNYVSCNIIQIRDSILKEMYPNPAQSPTIEQIETAFVDIMTDEKCMDLRETLIHSITGQILSIVQIEEIANDPVAWFNGKYDSEKQKMIGNYLDFFSYVLTS